MPGHIKWEVPSTIYINNSTCTCTSVQYSLCSNQDINHKACFYKPFSVVAHFAFGM